MPLVFMPVKIFRAKIEPVRAGVFYTPKLLQN